MGLFSVLLALAIALVLIAVEKLKRLLIQNDAEHLVANGAT
jgi:hypothetical protein